jgi:hypothetical protein
MPPIPFPHSHSICIELFIQVIKEPDGLYYHGINLSGQSPQF